MSERRIGDLDLSSIVRLQQDVVMASLDLIELMELICQKTQVLTRATGAVVEMLEDNEMVYRAASGTLKDQVGLRLNIDTSLSGLCVKSAEVLNCADSENDERVNREACRKVGARSMICVPLIHLEKAIGVLKVISSEADSFKDREVNILKLIAGLLSASIFKAETEKLLKDSEQRAIAATQAKSDFLASMSHEIRTPLNGVLGVALLLEETNLTKQQADYIKLIQTSAESLLYIVNDILDFSKIEARKMLIEQVDFRLFEVVNHVHQILMPMAQKKNIEIRVESEENVPKVVIGDPNRLRQVFLNLLSNAVKFTSEGSVTLRIKKTDDMITFDVEDTGIGMSPEALKATFSPYTQATQSTARKFGGTGLGLTISKQLIEMMGGEIGVRSIEGKGTTFWFELSLPASDADVPASIDLSDDSTEGPPLKVLVADDISVNQVIVKVLLEKAGHKVTVVSSGLEALKALDKDRYDMVLMDCQMPEMDGFEATARIRKSSQDWSNIHIVAMTANAMEGDRERCLGAGMDDYITKPIKKNDLLATIKKTQPRPESSINHEMIQELKAVDEDGSNQTLKILIGLYLTSAPEKVKHMEVLLKAKNYPELRMEAHSLRSSSLNLGAEKLASIASEIEFAKEDVTLDERMIKIQERIVKEFERVDKELNDLLNKS